jgi:large subunit ribosomal protein L5
MSIGVKEKTKKAFEKLKGAGRVSNIMEAPKLTKVVISVGAGRSKDDKRKLAVIEDRLAKITGQKAAPAPAKKSIATFKVRAGETTGYKVTLRGDRMYNFIDKFINIAIPRTRDFRGIKLSSIDDMGNLTIGVKEHIIFPETGDEEINDIFGLSVTLTSSAKNKEDAKLFFEEIGIPFKKEDKK